ncbi:MAG: glycoside hydrolase family 55 protein [Marinilabiliales bacterium]|nr:glycoside hydrolase family 55 protein [Marinilabiliales bacterium]
MKKKMILLTLLLACLWSVSGQNKRALPPGEFLNVRAFGAKGDGHTDDTQAIQSAILEAVRQNGRIVWFPAGIYRIGGPILDSVDHHPCKAQLYIPYREVTASCSIILQGECAPEFEAQGLIAAGPSRSGVVLVSDRVSKDSATAVMGVAKGLGKGWKQWSYVTPYIRDLGIRTTTRQNGSQIVNAMGALNLRYASKCVLDNLLIDTDTPLSESLDPASGGSTGITMPGVDNHALAEVGLVRIGGYGCGIRFSEHFVAKDVQVLCCHVGIAVEFSHHSSSIQTLEIECCSYPVLFKPGHNLFVSDYNTEHFTDPKWFRFVRDVTFEGKAYYAAKMVIGLCHPVVSNVGYDPKQFSTNAPERVKILENQ